RASRLDLCFFSAVRAGMLTGRRLIQRGDLTMRLLSPLASLFALSAPLALAQSIPYPQTQTGDVVDELHGVQIPDPYRWLEDLDAAETAAWVAAQNEVTFGSLRQVPQREAIKQRLTALWDYEKFGLPSQESGRYFYTKN